MSTIGLGYSFFALLVMLTTLLLRWLPERPASPAARLGLALALALAALFSPLPDGPGYYYLRAYFGELSMTSVLFFAALLLHRATGKALFTAAEKRSLLIAVGILGICLYPMALGLGPFDPYGLGYQPHGLLLVVFPAALYCWYRGHTFLLMLLLLATVAFSQRIFESTNLWDYLIDPILWIYAIIWLLIKKIRQGGRGRTLP
jgi:hypothetical protein